MADGSITIDTKIDRSQSKKDLQKIGEDVNKLSTDVEKSSKKITANLKEGFEGAAKFANKALIGIAAGITAVSGATLGFAKATDRIDKMSQRLNLTRETFQQWDYVLSQNGVSIDSLGMSMKTLTQRMQEGHEGFNQLGVSVMDSTGAFRNQEDVFKDTIVAFQGLAEGVEKSALAQELFGRNGQEMLPMLNASKGSIDEMMESAKELGLVLSDDTVKSGVILTDLLDTLKRAMDSLVNNAIAPLIPQINMVVKSFLDWAVAGDRLKNILRGFIDAVTMGFSSGLIPAVIAGALAIKGFTGAFAALNAVINANPISLIIIAVGALVAGIVMLYKNWDNVFTFLSETTQIIVSNFKIMGVELSTAFNVAAGSGVIAMTNLAQIITGKLLGAVGKFLDLLSNLPFVGEKFSEISKKVEAFRDNYVEMAEESKNRSKAIISDSIQIKKAFIEQQRSAIAEIRNRKIERINQAELEKKMSEEEAIAARAKAVEDEKNRLSGLQSLNNQILLDEKVLSIKGRIAQEEQVISQKRKDGFIDDEQQASQLLGSYEGLAEELYSLGVSANEFGNEGEKALFSLILNIDKLKKDVEKKDIPLKFEDLGKDINKSLARGIGDSAYNVLKEVKNIFDGMAEIIGSALGGRLGSAFNGVVDMFGKIAQGAALLYAGDVAGGSMALVEGLTMGLGVVQGLYSGFLDMVDFLVDFSVKDVIKGLEDSLKGLNNFFTNELFNISNMFTTGVNMIASFMDGISENEDVILEQIDTIFKNLATTIIENQDVFQAIASFITQIIIVIIDNLPGLISAGFSMLMAIGQGIMDNLDELISTFMDSFLMILNFVTENLGDFITMGILMVVAIAGAIVEHAPEIISALIQVFPTLVLAIIDSLPMLVEAFAELIPLLVIMMVEMTPTLVAAYAQVIVKMIEAMVDLFLSVPDIIVALFSGMQTGITQGMNIVINHARTFGGGFRNAFESLGESAYEGFTGAFGQILNFIDYIVDAIADFIETVGDVGGSIGGSVGAFFEGLGSDAGDLFGFATGSAYIEQDQVAQIHQGERIIPKTFNESIMSGETMMLSSDSFASIMAGIQSGVNVPSMGTMGASNITLVANINGTVEVEGQSIGRIAFEYMDEYAGAGFGS